MNKIELENIISANLSLEEAYELGEALIKKRMDYIDSLPEKHTLTVEITKHSYGWCDSSWVGKVVRIIKTDKSFNWWCLWEDRRKKEGNRVLSPENFKIMEQ